MPGASKIIVVKGLGLPSFPSLENATFSLDTRHVRRYISGNIFLSPGLAVASTEAVRTHRINDHFVGLRVFSLSTPRGAIVRDWNVGGIDQVLDQVGGIVCRTKQRE